MNDLFCLMIMFPFSVREKLQKCNKCKTNPKRTKTNPNEPNFSEVEPHSKPKNTDSRQFHDNLFYAKRTQIVLVDFQFEAEYELSKNMESGFRRSNAVVTD